MTVFSKSARDLAKICKILKQGEVVAAPTETAYGLLADATNPHAITKVFIIKGRAEKKVLPLAVSNYTMAQELAVFSPLAKKLARGFWPGPLTLVLPARVKLPPNVVSLDKFVGLRMSGSTWLTQLVKTYGRPLTVTSANLSGQSSLYDAVAVQQSLSRRGLKYIVRSRRLPLRPTSTIVKVAGRRWRIIRLGAITPAKLRSVIR
ncbi:MAG: L-threonylcarbamoyladenylate synthase [Patescibacteria group bacterium]